MTEQTRTPTTTRILNVATRFVQAERHCCDNHAQWEVRRIDWSRFPSLPLARAQTYVSGSIERNAAAPLLKHIESWFGPHFQFQNLFWGTSTTQVDEKHLEMFEKMLRAHSFAQFNSALLKDLINNLRAQETNAECVERFKRVVWDEGALGLMLDAAHDYWNRPGAASLINKVARELASLFTIEVNLMTEDETLHHMLVVLEHYADAYEAITAQATLRHRDAVEYTAAR